MAYDQYAKLSIQSMDRILHAIFFNNCKLIDLTKMFLKEKKDKHKEAIDNMKK